MPSSHPSLYSPSLPLLPSPSLPLLPSPLLLQCLVVGEITCSKMVVVLNKVDLLEDKKKEKHISKVGGVQWVGKRGWGTVGGVQWLGH